MVDSDPTMKSPLSKASSIFLILAGIASGIFFNFTSAAAEVNKFITIYHGAAFIFALFLIMIWKRAPLFMASVIWITCLYSQGYAVVIIVLTSHHKISVT